MAPTSAQARAASHRSWAYTEDRAARTAAARAASLARFERQVDPEGRLTEQERAIRAEHAMRAFMCEMSAKAAAARKFAAAQRSRVQVSGSPETPVVDTSRGDLSGEAA